MNSKLLTIICLIVILVLLSTLGDNQSTNLKQRSHKQQNTITGRIISQYGIPIQTKLEMTINDKKYQFSSDKDGNYVIQFPDGKNGEKYTAQISTTSLLLGYSYMNPITTETFLFQQGSIKFSDITLNESGFGSIVVKGTFKIANTHLQLSVQQDKKKYQANAISLKDGGFEFRLFGIKSLPLSAYISVIDNLQLYEPIQNLSIQIEGISTIVQIKPLELQLSKCNNIIILACRLIGCKQCNENNQKCSECSYGYKLDNQFYCKFGTFKGTGDVSVNISNQGEIIKIVGTLLDNKFEPMKDQLVCLSDDNINCIALGGSNHLGQFEMLVQSLKVGILKYKFIVNDFSREIQINGDESVQNLGLITIY